MQVMARTRAWVASSKRLSTLIGLANTVQYVALGFAIVLLSIWIIPPLRAPLVRYGLFDDASLAPIFELLLALTLVVLGIVAHRLSALTQAVADLTPVRSTLIRGGVSYVYPALLSSLSAVEPSQRSVDVLGLTLYTAWPHLKGFLDTNEQTGWTIRMLCLDPAFIKSSEYLDSGWCGSAEATLKSIQTYQVAQTQKLSQRGVSIDVRCYRCPPAIHGFRIGDGTVYMSASRWEAGVIAEPHYEYEVFRADDRTNRAEAYRRLFDNWFTNALQSTNPATQPGTSQPGAVPRNV